MPPVVESTALRCLVLCASAAGIDVGRILEPYGLTEATFGADAPASSLTLATAVAVVERLVASPPAGWALRGATRMPQGAMGVLDHLCSAAPTARACLSDFARYFGLVAYRGSVGFDDGVLELAFDVGPVQAERCFVEATFGLLWSRLRFCLGRADVSPVRVEVRASVDAQRQRAWQQAMGVEAVGQSELNRIVVSAAVCDTPLQGSNAPLRAFLEHHAEAALPTMSDTWTDRVGRQLAMGLVDTSLASVAKQLAVSERTLRRRLADEGNTFLEIRQRELQRRAEAMLSAGTLSHGEIAFALGFSEMSAFSRAFRRWTGQAPGAWRQSAQRA